MSSQNNLIKRFIIYTRCSTDDQARGEYTTLDAQAHHCKNYLEAKGYSISRIVKDNGYSGKDLKRPGIQDILKEITPGNQKRSFDGIIFFRLDRLTRNPRDLYALIDLFNKYNIEFLSVQDNYDSSTPTGRIMIGILGHLSAFERELTGERVKASGIARVRQGKWIGGCLPYGYQLINDGSPLPDGRQPHKILPDGKLAPKIKLIWEMAAANKSLMTIAKELEKRGVKSPKGITWRKQSLLNIIRNPFYKGYVRWARETHKGRHNPLVDHELWERANKMISAKLPGHRFVQKPKTYLYLLEGLLKCGKCGSHYITTHSIGQHNGRFHYYVCGRKKQGLGCDSQAISALAFDNAVIKYFKDSSQDQKIILRAIKEAVLEAREKLSHISKDLRKMESRLRELKEEAKKLLDLAVRGTISKGSTYKTRMEEIETEIAGLEEKWDKLQAQKKAAEISAESSSFIHSNLAFAMERFDKAAPEAQKGLIQSLVKEITVYDGHVKLAMFAGAPLQETFPIDNSAKRKRPTVKNGALTAKTQGSPMRQIKLPREDSNLGPGGYT